MSMALIFGAIVSDAVGAVLHAVIVSAITAQTASPAACFRYFVARSTANPPVVPRPMHDLWCAPLDNSGKRRGARTRSRVRDW